MQREGRLAVAVGSFVLVSLLALAISILSLTSERGLFVTYYNLEARFENVQGLLAGAPVWLAGKEVGRVEAIHFEPVGSEQPVLVDLGIDVSVQDRIRLDSVASIGTIGVLGDAYVELTVGSAGEPMLKNGDELRSLSPINLNLAVAKGSRALDSVADLADSLNRVVESFERDEGGARAAQGLTAASKLLIQLQEGPGLLHSLIYDEYEGQGVESIERSLASLENILREVRDGDGILHTLIYDRSTDRSLVNQTMAAGARLNSILEKIDRGEGTLGLMVNDPSVYEELQQLLGGARRSVVLRSMVRMAVDDDGAPPKAQEEKSD
jgi:phospholipid/cholesterol/gamma-HCH transport system substrate-binding protein